MERGEKKKRENGKINDSKENIAYYKRLRKLKSSESRGPISFVRANFQRMGSLPTNPVNGRRQ